MDNSGLYHVTFLRHGESLGNQVGVRQGQAEFPLTEVGHRQVEALLRHWRDVNRAFDLIISSPLERASRSAEILAAGLGTRIDFEPLWMERHGGNAQGTRLPQPQPEAVARAPLYRPLFDGGESVLDLYVRGLQAVQALIGRRPGKYLIVSHGAILNAATLGILGVAPTVYPPPVAFQFDNTGYMDLTYDPDALRWRILRCNVRNHLSETLP